MIEARELETIEMMDGATVGDIRHLASLDGGMNAPMFIRRDSYTDGLDDFPLGDVKKDEEDGHLVLHPSTPACPPMTAWDFLGCDMVRDAFDDVEMTHSDEVSWNAAQEMYFYACELARRKDDGSYLIKIW